MNDQLSSLEQSILQHDTSPVAQQTLSLSEQHPALYLTLMSMFAAAGYAWLLIFPTMFLFLLVYIPYDIYQASNYLQYSFVLLEVLFAGVTGWMSYAMWKLDVSQPLGRPLTQDEAPALRTLLDELCKKHHVPRINRIRVVRDFSVELVRTSANGFPFNYSYTLLIGLPIMQSLNARYFLSAIEREVVHLAAVHRRPAAWLYFARQQWSQYHQAWQKKWSVPALLMRSFFSWYAPLYKLLSQSACRMQHYYADQNVQMSLHDETLAHMLITANICSHYLENDFWPHLYSKAYRHKQPPYLPYASLDHNLRAKLDVDNAQAWLNAEMEKTAQSSDMPTLKQRLNRLSVHRVTLPPPVMESAARYFLGNNLKVIAGQLDQVWLKTHTFEWQQKYQQGMQQQQRLRSLIMQSMQILLTDETAWELIQLAKRFLSDDRILPLYKQILHNSIDDARVFFDIGRTLLANSDEQGVATLEEAIELDDSYTVIACQLMTKFFVQTGNSKSAQNYRRRALAYQVNAA